MKPSYKNFTVGFTFPDSNMATRKRLILIASLPLVIAVALGVLAMLPPGPGVTKANFDRIEKGMTMVEVKRIFGEEGTPFLMWSARDWKCWQADDGSDAFVEVVDDCAGEKHWTDSNETFFNKIRRWLHLR